MCDSKFITSSSEDSSAEDRTPADGVSSLLNVPLSNSCEIDL